MPSGNGPCRFGQYHRFHRLVLDDLGFQHVPIYSPNQDETLYNDLGITGSEFTRLGWQGIVAVDLLMKKLLETRPYVRGKRESPIRSIRAASIGFARPSNGKAT